MVRVYFCTAKNTVLVSVIINASQIYFIVSSLLTSWEYLFLFPWLLLLFSFLSSSQCLSFLVHAHVAFFLHFQQMLMILFLELLCNLLCWKTYMEMLLRCFDYGTICSGSLTSNFLCLLSPPILFFKDFMPSVHTSSFDKIRIPPLYLTIKWSHFQSPTIPHSIALGVVNVISIENP